WLDVVRYTESQGFEYDRLRDNAWHYRDYVINSFNADKPYNQFIKEQLAGDVLEPVTRDSMIATSMLVCGPWDEAGSSQANLTQRMVTREEELEDLVAVVSQTFVGSTVHCARCHDHKFDPIPQEDYYAMKAVFEGVRHGESPVITPMENRQRNAETHQIADELSRLQKKLGELKFAKFSEFIKKQLNQSIQGDSELKPIYQFGFQQEFKGILHQADVSNGILLLNGESSYFESAPLDRNIHEKTLEAWVFLTDLDQRGGGIITIENLSGAPFDSIVFGEREPRKWTAGSEGFVRTKGLSVAEETATFPNLVHMVATYHLDGSIVLYRDGKQYGETYKTTRPISFEAGKSRVLLGMRHTGGGKPYFAGGIAGARIYDKALNAGEVSNLFASLAPAARSLLQNASEAPELQAEVSAVEKQIASLKEKASQLSAVTVSYIGKRSQPGATKFLKRGDVGSPMGDVKPGALSRLPTHPALFGLPVDAPEADRRIALANWMASEKNPLTARVMVNRVWSYHFGEGLVATPSDFGHAGSTPSHPALLDWLAYRFMADGWSVKKLHKQILASAVFKQSSALRADYAAKDSGNALLWRFAPRRLQAEEVRDSLLSISGELNQSAGGPGFRPFKEIKFGSSTFIPEDKIGPEFNRRTVYRMNVNSGKDPMLDAFDCPDPSVKTPKRSVTTTPMQALALMNNSLVQRQASALAAKLTKEETSLSLQIAKATRLTWGRELEPSEAEKALAFAQKQGLEAYIWALFNSTEFLYVQ
ncbi:MAG: DUF1553 domain-containing protein, partial [Verrucomicrobiales bacterium]